MTARLEPRPDRSAAFSLPDSTEPLGLTPTALLLASDAHGLSLSRWALPRPLGGPGPFGTGRAQPIAGYARATLVARFSCYFTTIRAIKLRHLGEWAKHILPKIL